MADELLQKFQHACEDFTQAVLEAEEIAEDNYHEEVLIEMNQIHMEDIVSRTTEFDIELEDEDPEAIETLPFYDELNL